MGKVAIYEIALWDGTFSHLSVGDLRLVPDTVGGVDGSFSLFLLHTVSVKLVLSLRSFGFLIDYVRTGTHVERLEIQQ